MKTVEVCRIAPSTLALPPDCSHAPPKSLPLTFFDIYWLRLLPSRAVYFYEISPPSSTDTATFFFDTVLPSLKRSLSLALGHHFLPFAGEVTWPPSSPKPIAGLPEDGGGVSLTVAESTADFRRLSDTDDFSIGAAEFRSLTPTLPACDERAAVVAFLVTVFTAGGFSVGTCMNHTVLDGKSFTAFMRSWAHICRSLISEASFALPPDLIPSYDKALIQDPSNLGELFSDQWQNLDRGPGNRSVKPLELEAPPGFVRGTFRFPRAKIESLRRAATASLGLAGDKARVSAFSLVYAFAAVRLAEAEEIGAEKVTLFISVDCRSRLDPPVPSACVGNCVVLKSFAMERRVLQGREGLFQTVKAINENTSSLLGRSNDELLKGAECWVQQLLSLIHTAQCSLERSSYSVVSSPHFGVYKTDFGWGPPRRVEVVTIDANPGAISLSDTRNGDGVEIGLVLKKHQMEAFATLYAQGLESL